MKKNFLIYIIAMISLVIILVSCAQTDTTAVETTDGPSSTSPQTTEEVFAFMAEDGFLEIRYNSYSPSAGSYFRHDPDMKYKTDEDEYDEDEWDDPNVQPPSTFVYKGTTYPLERFDYLLKVKYCHLEGAPSISCVSNSSDRLAAAGFDEYTGHCVALWGLEIENIGYNQPMETYIEGVKRAIATYMPEIDVENLVYAGTSVPAAEKNGYTEEIGAMNVRLQYYYQGAPTAFTVRAWYENGILTSIRSFGYFDAQLLTDSNLTVDTERDNMLLESFAAYACNTLPLYSWETKEALLYQKTYGEFAVQYTIEVTADDNGYHRQKSFKLQIEVE